MLELIITFLVGVLSSILSGVAGGGGGLIAAPFFIYLGLPPQVAVATTKFGALGLTVGSLAKFRKTEYIRKEYLIYLSILSIVAAIIGSRILLISSNEMVEKIVGVMILIAIPFLFNKQIGLVSSQASRFKKAIGYGLYFIILTLQAAFGAGIGMMLMLVMMGIMGFTALEANATRRIPGFLLATIALIIYMANGVVYYGHGLAILGGTIVGGYIGSHIAINRGNAFVKIMFAIVVAVLGVNLLLR